MPTSPTPSCALTLGSVSYIYIVFLSYMLIIDINLFINIGLDTVFWIPLMVAEHFFLLFCPSPHAPSSLILLISIAVSPVYL